MAQQMQVPIPTADKMATRITTAMGERMEARGVFWGAPLSGLLELSGMKEEFKALGMVVTSSTLIFCGELVGVLSSIVVASVFERIGATVAADN